MNLAEAIPLALQVLAGPLPHDYKIKPNDGVLASRISHLSNGKVTLSGSNIMELVSVLVSKGYAFVDYSQPSPDYWCLCLSDKGRNAIEESGNTPDDPPAYLRKISKDIPDLSATARLYLEESLRCYASENYIASTMMLGVSSEAIFYDTAGVFADWLKDDSGTKLKESLDKKGTAFVHKFSEFQKRLLVHKPAFPHDLGQNIDLSMNSLLEMYRLARNDVGHPTGIPVKREDCFQYIVVFPLLARRLYGIRNHCKES